MTFFDLQLFEIDFFNYVFICIRKLDNIYIRGVRRSLNDNAHTE